MNRPDHQDWAIAPRWLRALSPPSTALGLLAGKKRSFIVGLCRQREQLTQLVGGEFGQPRFAVTDDGIGQGLLLLDHGVDPLLESACADELVDLHRALLADPERAVGGLVLHGRVPPA